MKSSLSVPAFTVMIFVKRRENIHNIILHPVLRLYVDIDLIVVLLVERLSVITRVHVQRLYPIDYPG